MSLLPRLLIMEMILRVARAAFLWMGLIILVASQSVLFPPEGAASQQKQAPPEANGTEKYRKHAEKIKLPPKATLDKIFAKDASYAAVREWVEDRKNWLNALKVIDEKLGLYSASGFEIRVEFSDLPQGTAAIGGFNGTGAIKINLATMAMAHQSGLLQIGPAITHELVHVFQISIAREKAIGWPDWLYEGMGEYSSGSSSPPINLPMLGDQVLSLDEEAKLPKQQQLIRAYGRGYLVFLFMEERLKSEGVKKFADLLINNRKDYKEALKTATKSDWKTFVADEIAWSQEWLKKRAAPGNETPAQEKEAPKEADDLRKYQKHVEKIKLSVPPSVKSLADKNPDYRAVRDWVEDKNHWSIVLQTIDRRLGLSSAQGFVVAIELTDKKIGAAALGGGEDDKGLIRVSLTEMAPEMDKIDKILTHEMIHVFQFHMAREGTLSWPGWLYEGMGDYGADIRWDFALLGGEVNPLSSTLPRLQAYGRGHLAFLYIEEKWGADGVKKFVDLLVGKKKEVKSSLKETTKTEWKKFAEDEQTWSKAWMENSQGKGGSAPKPIQPRQSDLYTASAASVAFPSADELKSLRQKDAQYDKIISVVCERKFWIAAMKNIDNRTGLFVPDVKITLLLSIEDGAQPGVGSGADGQGLIVIYLPRMASILKKSNVLNDRMIEYAITHELTHVYQGNKLKSFTGAPFWFVEGMCEYAAENLANVLTQPIPAKSIEVETSIPLAYGRGRAFYEFLAATFGNESVKKLIENVGKGKDYQKATEEIAGLSWSQVVEKERKWSGEWIKKEKSKFPGLRFDYDK